MKYLSIVLSALVIFLSSCDEGNVDDKRTSSEVNESLAGKEEQEHEQQESGPNLTGAEHFKIDTISEEEFNKAEEVYRNPFTKDATLFQKEDGVLTIELSHLSNKNIIFKDYEDPASESEDIHYTYEGRLGDKLYYVVAHYYEDIDGFIVQANGQVDTIYYAPVVSLSQNKVVSEMKDFGSIGHDGFTYFEYDTDTYIRKTTVRFHNNIFIDRLIWSGDELYCKTYYDDGDGKKKNYTYLKLTQK